MPKQLVLSKEALKSFDNDRVAKLKKAVADGKIELIIEDNINNSGATYTTPKEPSFQEKKDALLASGGQDTIQKALVEASEHPDKYKHKEPGFFDKVKNFFKRGAKELAEPVAQGAQNVIDVVSPIDVKISEHKSIGDEFDEAMDKAIDKDSVPYKVYERLGELSKTDEGFKKIISGKADKADVDTYIKNRNHLLVDIMGYKDVGTDIYGNTWLQDKDGKWLKLDEDGIKSIVGSTLGDKGELIGAMAGGSAGYKAGKALGTKGKIIGGLFGSALGAGTGNVADQLNSYLKNGEKLSLEQRLAEFNKAMALDAVGAGVGAGVAKAGGLALKVGGKAVEIPKEIGAKLYRHILNGNIDGATEILKKDLKLDDKDLDEALAQMQKWQEESYVKDEFGLKDVIDEIKQNPKNTKEAIAKAGDNLLDSLGSTEQKEKLLATAMSHPQGEVILKASLQDNPAGAMRLTESIDKRAKMLLDKKGLDGTEIKDALNEYRDSVKRQYGELRDLWSRAFSESGYRFDLDNLKLSDTIDSLSKRVTDPYVKQKFEAMADAIESIVDKNDGITRDIDDLLDIRQSLNKFYRKNKNALENRKDKETFRAMLKNIDNELERAVKEHLPQDIGEPLLKEFDKAKSEYKKMYELEDNALYKSLMADGKSSDERIDALVKHADDDAGELTQVLEKLPKDKAAEVEKAIVNRIISKNSLGESSKTQAVDYAKTLEDLKKVEPFLKGEESKALIDMLKEFDKTFKHDAALYRVAKSVDERMPDGGIATSVTGRLHTRVVGNIFRHIVSLLPYSESAKRIALYKHIASALKKSRTPKEALNNISKIKELPKDERRYLKDAVRDFVKIEKENNEAKRQELLRLREEKERQREAELKAKEEALEKFETPELEELKAVEELGEDDRYANLARSIANIQQGRATITDIKRYLDAKAKIGEDRLNKKIEKIKINRMKQRYTDIGQDEINKLERLRDYMLSHPELKFGSEFNGKSFKSLIYHLKNYKAPKNLEQDELYKKAMSLYKEFEDDISREYDDIIDDNPF